MVDRNDDTRGIYNKNSQIKFKTSVLKSSWCHYSDVYILVSGTITITRAGVDDEAKQLDERNKEIADGNTKNVEIAVPLKYLSNF